MIPTPKEIPMSPSPCPLDAIADPFCFVLFAGIFGFCRGPIMYKADLYESVNFGAHIDLGAPRPKEIYRTSIFIMKNGCPLFRSLRSVAIIRRREPSVLNDISES